MDRYHVQSGIGMVYFRIFFQHLNGLHVRTNSFHASAYFDPRFVRLSRVSRVDKVGVLDVARIAVALQGVLPNVWEVLRLFRYVALTLTVCVFRANFRYLVFGREDHVVSLYHIFHH